MDESILNSIKKLLGLPADYSAFDEDVIVHINSTLFTLNQLGVGPSGGFVITGKDETWKEYIGNEKDFQLVKSYIYLKIRLMFDPPQNSFLVTSMEKQTAEYEWRLMVQADPGTVQEGVELDE